MNSVARRSVVFVLSLLMVACGAVPTDSASPENVEPQYSKNADPTEEGRPAVGTDPDPQDEQVVFFSDTVPEPEWRPPEKRIIPKNPVDIRTVNQAGHSSYISDLEFSPDGRYLASVGDDTVRIWEMATGLQLKRYPIDGSGIYFLEFLDNEHLFWYASAASKKVIANIFTDEKYSLPDDSDLRVMPSRKKDTAYAFSPAREREFSWRLRTLNLKTRETTSKSFPRGACTGYGYRFMDFSEEKHLAMFTCYDRSIELWDVNTMRRVVEIPVSPKKKVAHYWPNRAYFVPGTELIFRVMEFEDETSDASVVNYRTGQVISRYDIPHIVTDVEWRPNSTEGVLSLDDGLVRYNAYSAVLLDVVSGRQSEFRTEGRGTNGLALSKDGRLTAVPDADHGIRIFDADTQKELRRLGENMGIFRAVDTSPVDTRLAGGTSVGALMLFDLFNLSLDKTLGLLGNTESFKSVEFTPDGRYLFSSAFVSVKNSDVDYNTSRLWDVESGELVRSGTSREDAFNPILFLPDNRRLYSSTLNHFNIIDAESWKPTVRFDDKMLQYMTPVGRHGVVGYFSEKGIRSTGDLVLLSGADFENRTVIDRITLGYHTDFNIAALDENRFIVMYADQYHVYDLATRTKIQQFDASYTKKCREDDLYVSDDGAFAALTHRTSSYDSCPDIVIVDVANEREIAQTKTDGFIYNGAFFDGHRYFTYGDSSGGLVVWNLENNHKIGIVSDGEEWVFYTEDGFFTASRNGGKLVAAVSNMHGYRIDQIAIRNNRPDIIMQRMKLGSEEMIESFYALYRKRVANYGVDEEQLAYVFGAAPKVTIMHKERRGRFVEVTFTASDPGAEIKRYNIYVNDVPLFGMGGKPYTSADVKETVSLHSGTNKIEISAMNALGIESLREHFEETNKQPQKGDLYYVGFGVSKYRDPKMNLEYAAKDADDLGQLFEKHAEYFNNVHVKTFTNEDVGPKAFKEATRFVEQSKVDDTVVVFVAGHGLYDTEGDLAYYYLVSSSRLDNLKQTAVNYQLIESLLGDIRARRKLLLLDTCQSGALDERDVALVSNQSQMMGVKPRGIQRKHTKQKLKTLQRALAQQSKRYIYNDLFRRTGAIVFSSSRGSEFSYESDRFENGNFTEAIIESLTTGEADKNGDRKVSTDELRSYVSETVTETTGGLQHPVVDRDNLEMTFDFPL